MDNYKQKYERLTKSIKDLYPYMLADCKKKVEGIILELEMGEDENIRKDLIDFLKSPFVNENITDEKVTPWIAWLKKQDNKNIYTKQELLDMGFSFTLNGDIVTPDEMMEDMKKYLAWKEKQSEKTPSDKVEPKFNVGDWITSGTITFQIVQIEDNYYVADDGDKVYIRLIDKNYHLWSIQDAKDGDVLANEDMVLIFKHFDEPSYRQHITAHIGLDTCGHIQITNESWNLGLNGAHPATKKQRDLLFQKMREAGYEWDAEKKELKIIEQKNIEGTFINVDDVRENFVKEVYRVLADDTTNDKANDIIYYFDSLPTIYLHTNKPLAPDGDDFDMDDILKNHVWSEEDELQMQGIIDLLPGLSNRHNWLKSLKERVQSQNFTVTDEELAQAKKDAYNDALDKIEYHSGEPTFDDGWSAAIDFIQKKSLSPQPKYEWSKEDERIKKECISIINAWDKSCRLQGDYCEVAPKCIAWLEKQGSKEENLKEHNIYDTCEDSNGCLITCCAKVLEKQGKETQDPCEKCNHPMLNCCNFPCIQKKTFDQSKTILDDMNEKKVDNQNCVKAVWNEEDEEMWVRVINEIEAIKSNSSTVFEKNIAQDKIDWLKSLKNKLIQL